MMIYKAGQTANQFMELIQPYCDRLEIGGSIRRGKSEVKDIEIIARPKLSNGDWETLTGEKVFKDKDLLQERMISLKLGQIIQDGARSKDNRRAPFSERYYKIQFHGQPIDLFSVKPPADWGIIFTIRTGPALFSKNLMIRAQYQGLHVSDGQLLRIDTGERIPCPEESDFFNVLGLDWIPPEKRV